MTEVGPFVTGPNDTTENGIYQGDARELVSLLPPGSVDVVFTDPPFGTGTYETDVLITPEFWVVLRPACRGPFAVWGYARNHMEWAPGFEGLSLLAYIVWYKYNEPVPSLGLTRVHQDIAVWGHSMKQLRADRVREPYTHDKSMSKWFFGGGHQGGIGARLTEGQRLSRAGKPHPEGRRCTDLWAIPAPGHGFNSHLRRHPNEKPEEACDRVLRLLTRPGDIVLDPFTGSGTIPAVCKRLGRQYLAFEVARDTCEAARQRVRDTQPPLFTTD